MMKINNITAIAVASLFLSLGRYSQSFVVGGGPRMSRTHLWALSTSIDEIQSMRVGEIKKELESYGISTRSFLEKKELVEALVKAREDGLEPVSTAQQQATATTSSSSSTSSNTSTDTSSASSSSTASSDDSRSREERLAEEMENCQKMKASEMRKELEERGVSTKSFFEKSEFVKALAEARVDGVQKKAADTEGYAEYANVEVLTSDEAGPRKRQSEQEQQQQQSSPFGGATGGNPFGGAAGGNPFGGAAGGNPFGGGAPGGMGGMGGIADMLKNFGMGGPAAGGGNPFAGGAGAAGANPFGGMGGMGGMGDAMGKAQEMMKNPKVMEIMAKAQSNPKIMAAMQECMSNPAAFAKYQNDPEVAGVINELRKYI